MSDRDCGNIKNRISRLTSHELTWRVIETLQLHLFQRYDVLFVVFLLANDDVAVNEDVVEQEELSGFRSLAAHFCEHTLADEHAARDEQRLTGAAEAALHHLYSTRICFAIYCKIECYVRQMNTTYCQQHSGTTRRIQTNQKIAFSFFNKVA